MGVRYNYLGAEIADRTLVFLALLFVIHYDHANVNEVDDSRLAAEADDTGNSIGAKRWFKSITRADLSRHFSIGEIEGEAFGVRPEGAFGIHEKSRLFRGVPPDFWALSPPPPGSAFSSDATTSSLVMQV